MIPNNADFEPKVSLESETSGTIEEPPFHILLLGDWSGGSNKSDLSQRRPIFVDRDNFDEVIRKLNVHLDLNLKSEGEDLLSLRFTELEDFHPDKIYQQIPLFSRLRDIRRRLLNTNTFNEASKEVRSLFAITDKVSEIQEVTTKEISEEISHADSENLLDQILSKPREDSSSNYKPAENAELTELLRKLVKPYLVEIDESEQSNLLAAIDEATSNLMRLILHDKKFQSLEATWRALYFLIRRVETDVDLKIYLLDASKDEIISNLKSVNNLADSYLYKWLAQETIQTPGGEPWAVVGGNYAFDLNIDDIAGLIRIGKLANTANAPFISHIRPEVMGVASLADNPQPEDWNILQESKEYKLWTTLRDQPESSYLGLAIPRFLARLPYGKETEPIESFSFEEFSSAPEHNNYLWANPCFACILLISQTFRANGWEMTRFYQDIEGLPTHIYLKDGETFTKPCSEISMTMESCEKILDQGLMPLISYKNSDKIRLARFQSIASQVSALKGRWNH